MSDNKQLEPWKEAMVAAKPRFEEIATTDKIVDWQRESMFALQAVERQDYLRKVANSNPASMRNAIINVAAIGITLNPAAQYAALVPRKDAVCLDIMYRGLIKIATDAGSIRWVQADLVHETDEFIYSGKVGAPVHKVTKLFGKDRGAVVGVYCVAKTVDGAGSNSAPTFTGTPFSSVINHTHAVTITDGGHSHPYKSQTATTGAATSYEHGVIDTSSTEAAEGETTDSATTGITASTANPAGGVASITPAGTVAAPAFTGSATSVVQPSLVVYVWKRTL